MFLFSSTRSFSTFICYIICSCFLLPVPFKFSSVTCSRFLLYLFLFKFHLLYVPVFFCLFLFNFHLLYVPDSSACSFFHLLHVSVFSYLFFFNFHLQYVPVFICLFIFSSITWVRVFYNQFNFSPWVHMYSCICLVFASYPSFILYLTLHLVPFSTL